MTNHFHNQFNGPTFLQQEQERRPSNRPTPLWRLPYFRELRRQYAMTVLVFMILVLPFQPPSEWLFGGAARFILLVSIPASIICHSWMRLGSYAIDRDKYDR